MSKKVPGDPKEDAKAQKAFKVIDQTFYASNQFKASNLRNYDIETLKRMADISRDFSMANKYITVRLEQSDGAQKAQINALEKRVSELEVAQPSTFKTTFKTPIKLKIKKPIKSTKKPVVKPTETTTVNTNPTVTTNVQG